MSILQLSRRLQSSTETVNPKGFVVRVADFPSDLVAWLSLREVATKELSPRPGLWTLDDSRRELMPTAGRQNARTWLAFATNSIENAHDDARNLAGSVTLLIRCQGCSISARIHWLLVAPPFRRRGIGRLLMATAENTCFAAGIREISLETHRNWTEAMAFYERLGYAPK